MTDTLRDRLQEALGRDYRVERELGGGGMSRVFSAVEVELDRRVVLKVLPPEMAAEVNVERFRREIQVAAGLHHPHIVPVHTAGRAGDVVYFTMPLIDGESLRARLDREGPLPVAAAVAVLRDVAGALAYAHQRGVVHRDIKPDNILLSGDHALVTDFGVAKALDERRTGAPLTVAGLAVGTPAYMAPEQAAGEPDVDHRADIYGAGVLAYEMLTGDVPFAGGTYQQILAAQLTESAPALARRRPEVPPAVARLVARCLERKPADRFQSAEALRREVLNLLTPAGTLVTTPPRRPLRRRVLQVGAGLAAVAALGWGLVTLRGAIGGPPPSPTAIAVLPFTVRGGPEVAYLGEGIVNLLSTSLDGAGDLRSVDPRALLGVVRGEGSAGRPLDPANARRIAERLGAGLYVLGDIVEAGDRVRLDAALYARAPGNATPVRATAEGRTSELFALVDSLAVQLLAGRGRGPGARITRIAAVTTSSLPALKAYLEGESHFRAGRFVPAVESFQAAVRHDSLFALGYYRLSVASEWALRPLDARTAAGQAVRYADRLSAHDRQLLEAMVAARDGDAERAERLYREILGLHPDDVDAWFQLGEVLFHQGPLLGRSFAESRAAFERVVAFEPDHATALVHLARIAAREARDAALDSLVGAVLALNPGGDRVLEMEALRVAAAGDTDRWDDFAGLLRQASDVTVPQALFSLLMFTDDFDAMERIAQLATAPGRSAETRSVSSVQAAYALALQGRWAAADSVLRASATFDRDRALVHRAYFLALPFRTVPRAELESMRRAVAAWDPESAAASTIPNAHFNVHNGAYPLLRLYLLGRLATRLGDRDGAAARAGDIERLAMPVEWRELARTLAAGLRLPAATDRAGLTAFGAELLTGNYEPKLFSPFYSKGLERFVLGERFESLGHRNEARRWFASLLEFSFFERPFEAPARWRLARIHEAAGRADSAVAQYERVVRLWAGGDAEVQPTVAAARAALARPGRSESGR